MEFFNSAECEWADLRVYLAGVPVTKITGVQYKSKKEKELLFAEGDQPIATQSGNRTYDGTITLLKGAIDDLNTAAIAAGGKDLLDLEFDIVVRWRASADGTRGLHLDTLVGVQVTEYEKAIKQNDKKMEIPLPILFRDMVPA